MDLFQAIRRKEAIAPHTLRNVPDVNVRDEDGQGLLHTAVAYGNNLIVAPLIEAGIDVNSLDANGQTPLHYAAAHRNSDAAEQILSNGGSIAIEDKHGNTALWTAVFNARGKYEVVEIFIRHGGRQFAENKNRHGKSPLDFAKQIGDTHLVTMLGG